MLNEYVLLPCIFDTQRFENKDICKRELKYLTRMLLDEEALVRDLCDGKLSIFVKKLSSKHPTTKYIQSLKGKFFPAPTKLKKPPADDYIEWAREALRSHDRETLDGIIASPFTKKEKEFKGEKIIESIEQLDEADWWKKKRLSVCVERTIKDYLKHLNLILKRANSIMFIDPYLSPYKEDGYEQFYEMLQAINRPKDPPDIEFHLTLNREKKKTKTVAKTEEDYEHYFRESKKLTNVIKQGKLEVKFFIWDSFHDRYIISNLVGIMSGHSFSVSREREETTWTRLDRQRKEDIQKEFDKNSNKHKLQHYFTIS